MKKEDKRTKLEVLQDVREIATGNERLKAQANIDNHFFKNPPKVRRKVKKRKIRNDDDLWW